MQQKVIEYDSVAFLVGFAYLQIPFIVSSKMYPTSPLNLAFMKNSLSWKT